jgi:hypothetical protein
VGSDIYLNDIRLYGLDQHEVEVHVKVIYLEIVIYLFI